MLHQVTNAVPQQENGNLSVADLTKDKIAGLYENDEAFKDALANLQDGQILLGSYPDFKAVNVDEVSAQIKAVAAAREKGDTLTRTDWLEVQRRDWKTFFKIPACFVIFWTVFFVIFGREPKAAEAETAKA